MINELVEELTQFCDSIDSIDKQEAYKVIENALRITREALDALIVEFRCLRYTQDPDRQSDSTKVLRRFALSFDERAKNSKEVQLKNFEQTGKPRIPELLPDDYQLNKKDGVWNWVYEQNYPVWVEDFDDKNEDDVDRYLTNKAKPKGFTKKEEHKGFISKEFAKVYDITKSIIVIPFKPLLELADDVSGFLDVEFGVSKRHNVELFRSLEKLTEVLAIVLWKYEVWEANRVGTCEAVKRFKKRCNYIQKGTRPIKTFIYAPPPRQRAQQLNKKFSNQQVLNQKIEEVFKTNGIQVDIYDCTSNKTSLDDRDVLTAIKKAHLGVFDVSECDLNILLVLGMMLQHEKPCLILSDDYELQQPLILAPSSSLVEPVWFFKYRMEGKEFNFDGFQNKSWECKDLCSNFINAVRKKSAAFRAAREIDPN